MEESLIHQKDRGLITLNDYMAYSDFSFPYIKGINHKYFPEQDFYKVTEYVPLWYTTGKYHKKQRGNFLIARFDMVEPYRVILLENNLQIVLVSTIEHVLNDGTNQRDEFGNRVNNSYIHNYPIQQYELLGVKTKDRYMKDQNVVDGTILRADSCGEKLEVVIIEKVINGRFDRLVTLEETKSTIKMNDICTKTHDEFKKIYKDRMVGVNFLR